MVAAVQLGVESCRILVAELRDEFVIWFREFFFHSPAYLRWLRVGSLESLSIFSGYVYFSPKLAAGWMGTAMIVWRGPRLATRTQHPRFRAKPWPRFFFCGQLRRGDKAADTRPIWVAEFRWLVTQRVALMFHRLKWRLETAWKRRHVSNRFQ